MATIDSAVFSKDLIGQCEIALEAIGNLNYALMNLYQVPSGGSRYDIFKEEVFEMIYNAKKIILFGLNVNYRNFNFIFYIIF